MINVYDFKVDKVDDYILVRCRVSHPKLPEVLWAKVYNSRAVEISQATRWVALGILVPAMRLMEDVYVEGVCDSEFMYCLNGDLQYLLVQIIPNTSRIGLIIGSEKDAFVQTEALTVGTGFSAGIDSFFTLMQFSGDRVPDNLRVGLITNFNVGALGSTEIAAALFEKYSRRLEQFSATESLRWVSIDSNLDMFYRAVDVGFQSSHTIRNVAAANLVPGIHTYLYSSSYAFEHINRGIGDMSFWDPLILAQTSTTQLRFLSAGAGVSRLEKTISLAGYSKSFDYLDVCVGDPVVRAAASVCNCSVCWKCSRTLLTLEKCGALERFSSVFDVDKFRTIATRSVRKVRAKAVKGSKNDLDVLRFIGEYKVTDRLHSKIRQFLGLSH